MRSLEDASSDYLFKKRIHSNINPTVGTHCCLFHLLVQKIFLQRSIFFEHVQYFLNTVKFFDHGQKQDFTL